MLSPLAANLTIGFFNQLSSLLSRQAGIIPLYLRALAQLIPRFSLALILAGKGIFNKAYALLLVISLLVEDAYGIGNLIVGLNFTHFILKHELAASHLRRLIYLLPPHANLFLE